MSPEKNILQPPRGMRDFYPEDMAGRNSIFNAWKAAAKRFGFSEYDACVVESLDLLKRKAGEEIIDQIYHFKDKSDRDLALRPEMTPTLARMIAARQGSLTFPVKWFTIAQCFRYERTTRGRKREHYQWNLDVIGEKSCLAEVEVIAAALDSLATLGIAKDKVNVHFSSRSLLSGILESLGIEEINHAAVFLALDKRGKMDDDAIGNMLKESGLDSETIDKAFSITSIATLEEALAMLNPGHAAHEEISTFMSLLEIYGIQDMVKFDISIVRGLAYYTGIVFEALDADRKLRAIFGGGRYDNLLSDVGGKPATGVGLGFGDVVIAEILADSGVEQASQASTATVIGYMNIDQREAAIRLASGIRASGTDVDLALTCEKPKNFFSKAGKTGFKEAIYIGPDDIDKGTVRVKNLETREERELKL